MPWHDDFAAARNASFELCSGDWIIWLDADDVVPPASQEAILALKTELGDDVDAIFAPYHYRIAGDGRPTLSFPRERLIRRRAGFRWAGRVHECITVPADRSLFRPGLVIEHRPDPVRRDRNADRNLTILTRAVEGRDRGPRTLFYFANELYDHGRFAEAARNLRRVPRRRPDGREPVLGAALRRRGATSPR